MPFGLVLTSSPATEPVTTEEAKRHCRVTHDDEDDLIDGLIEAARQHVEEYLNRALITQTWRYAVDRFPAGEDPLRLPRPPLISVTGITYVDTDGATQTLSTSIYRVDSDAEPGRITLAYNQDWPDIREVTGSVQVTYTAGYGASASDVPRAVRQAILLLVGHWYENREATIDATSREIPESWKALCNPRRVLEVA